MNNLKIMLIDDEGAIIDYIKMYFSNLEYNIMYYTDSKQALGELNNNYYDLIVTDYKMPGINGIDLLIAAKKKKSYEYGILFTAYADKDILEKVLNRNLVSKVVEKPLDLKELKTAMDQGLTECVKKREEQNKHELLKLKYMELKNTLKSEIIGLDKGLRKIYEEIKSIIIHPIDVLITGETGTGKEVAAKLIHNLNPEKKGNFVSINCCAIPESLLESELFGYVKGAFTGAVIDKPGKIELAHGGTLLLDEIGEMKPDLQIKLLRVLQNKKVMRIGSITAKKIDFRLISTTNKDLNEAINNRSFRSDLYYRINIFHLHLPPLRERKGDIKDLTNHFIKKICREIKIKRLTITDRAIKKLKQYDWPGNIRELESEIKRAIVYAHYNNRQELDEEFFNIIHPGLNNTSVTFKMALDKITEEIINKKLDFKTVERDIIKGILKYFDGNVSRAVQKTNIAKNRFYRNR